MAEVQPLLLDKTLEAIPRAERAVQQKLRDRRDLRRAVPAVRTMDEDRGAADVHVARHRHRRSQHTAHVLDPPAGRTGVGNWFRRNWLRVVAVADGPGLLEFAEPALLLAVLAAMGKGVVRRPWLHQREERLERRTHSVDVLDAHEGNLRVRVVLRSLVTLAARAVDVGVQLRPAVDNLQEGGCLVS